MMTAALLSVVCVMALHMSHFVRLSVLNYTTFVKLCQPKKCTMTTKRNNISTLRNNITKCMMGVFCA